VNTLLELSTAFEDDGLEPALERGRALSLDEAVERALPHR
jgi:hypothetical protein